MSSKKKNNNGNGDSKKPSPKKGGLICASRGPGPRYKLKTLVGYEDHDTTKYRMPAYSFRSRQIGFETCDGPGPKYNLIDANTSPAFSFGHRATSYGGDCGPGPKYMVRPGPITPAFTIKSRTGYRNGGETPGPSYVPINQNGPAFSIGARPEGGVCDGNPGPMGFLDLNVIKPKAPMYSLASKQTGNLRCDSPGPKYLPNFVYKKPPMYSFGIKHSECAPPLQVECDEIC